MLLKREVFDSVEKLLTKTEKEYIKIYGGEGFKRKFTGFANKLSTILFLTGCFFIYLLAHNGIIPTDFSDGFQLVLLMVMYLLLIALNLLLTMMFSLMFSDMCVYYTKTVTFSKVRNQASLDFLLENKDKLSVDDYTEIFQFIKDNNLFKTSILSVLINLLKEYKEDEVKKEKEEEIKKAVQKRIQQEENYNKKIILAEMGCKKQE